MVRKALVIGMPGKAMVMGATDLVKTIMEAGDPGKTIMGATDSEITIMGATDLEITITGATDSEKTIMVATDSETTVMGAIGTGAVVQVAMEGRVATGEVTSGVTTLMALGMTVTNTKVVVVLGGIGEAGGLDSRVSQLSLSLY